MGIADDISPRRKDRTASSGLDGRDIIGDVRNHEKETETDEAKKKEVEEAAIFAKKTSDNDDFFPKSKNNKPEKREIVIEAKPKKNTERETTPISERFAGIPRRKLIVYCLLTIIVIFVIVRIGRSTSSSTDSTGSDAASAVTIVPNDYTSSVDNSTSTSSTAIPTTTPAATTAPATTPTAATTLTDKSTLTIDLLNGNGVNNTAATYKSILSNAGYTVGAVGNANNYKYWSTYVYYKTGLAANAAAIKTVLNRKSVLIVNDDTICKKYDIVITIGSH